MKLPGTSGFLKKIKVLQTILSQAAKLPGASGFAKKKTMIRKKVVPQAAKLPGTSGFFKTNQFSANSSAPGSEAAQEKLLRIKK